MASGFDFVMREKDFGIEIRDKTGRVEYVERATFSIELLKHVVHNVLLYVQKFHTLCKLNHYQYILICIWCQI